MGARLKVFVTSDGLTDYVVAASSRPKALAAWGAHQDLFKTGGARETDDPALVKAATATPGEVLRRPADHKGALAKAAKTPKPAKLNRPSNAALRKIETLEERLADLQTRREAAKAAIDAQRAELEARAEREAAAFDREAERLEDALRRAREAI